MSGLAIRALSRLGGEFHLSGIAALVRLLPDAGDEDILALVILRVCLPDWVVGNCIAPPVAIAHGTTLRSLARSLDRSTGTMHGLVQRLIDRGIVCRGDAGLHIAPAAAERVIAYLRELHDIVLRFAADAGATGALTTPHGHPRLCPVLPILAVGLDMMLVPFETFRHQIGDWTAKKLWIAISTLTVRHITVDPALSACFATVSTPDGERRAVPAALLRDITGTSVPTAWRRLKALEAAGVAARRDGGWLIGSGQLREPVVEAAVRAGVDYYLRRLNELVAVGLMPDCPPYRHGRPPLIAAGIMGESVGA